MKLLQQFKEYIKKENLFQQKDKLLLAVSGGVDSVVLCELCKQAGYDFEIAHCNFRLRGADSDEDEKFVEKLSKKYGVTFHVKSFNTKEYAAAEKKSIEEAARDLRYQWFNELIIQPENSQYSMLNVQCSIPNSRLLTPNYILTAHHADDVIETAVMNFFRGTGIKGIRGILSKQGNLIRPLLFAGKTDIENFAANNNLDFVTDKTNAENNYTRNYFRNKIIPLVSEAYPEVKENVLNNVKRFKETEVLYQQAIQLHKKKLLKQVGNEIHIPVLKLIKSEPLATIVYEIIKGFGFTAHQTSDVIALLQSESGKYIQSKTHRVIKNRSWLIISPNQTTEAQNILIEENNSSVEFAVGSLQIQKSSVVNKKLPATNFIAMLDADGIKFPLLLRKWKTGDYFYPLGMNKKKKLNRFFIDQKLSLAQKENMWVIEMNKKILWIIGMRIDDRFKITERTTSILQFKLTVS